METQYKILIGMIFIIAIIPMASAQSALSIVKQNTCISLIQICDNCTYNNITSIRYPDGTLSISNIGMQKTGTLYNSTFCDTIQIGTFQITGQEDPDGIITAWTYDFLSNASGSNMDIMFILFFILSYGLFAFALYIKNPYLGIFSGILMVLFGAFVYNQGFNSQRNFLTESIAFVTIALGLVTMTIGALEGFDHS